MGQTDKRNIRQCSHQQMLMASLFLCAIRIEENDTQKSHEHVQRKRQGNISSRAND